MSFVDYGQTASDHQSLLVLVRHTGSHLPTSLFNLGKCVDHEEFNDLFENYKKVKEEYATTIINSRLIIFGMNTDGSPLEKTEQPSDDVFQPAPDDSGIKADSEILPAEGDSELEDTEVFTSVVEHSVGDSGCGDNENNQSESRTTGEQGDGSEGTKRVSDSTNIPDQATSRKSGSVSTPEVGRDRNLSSANTANLEGKKKDATSGKEAARGGEKLTEYQRPHSNSLTKESTGSEVVFYPSVDQCPDLEDRLKEFVTSLFFVLEGKRLERTFERSDRLMLLCAPFEKKDYVGVDTDTKSFRRKCMGRLRKHLADLCLQAGLPGEAILHYQTSLDLLRAVNDFLWMGACYEGICSASVVLTFPRNNPAALRRNLSFSVKRGTSSPELKQRPGEGHPRTQLSTGSVANGLDHFDETSLHCLNPDDIIEKYKEAIMNYSKYKNSAMIEMEASLKACRVLIYQRKYLQASDFLQNVVYINLASSEEDKIQRYSTLSSLYGEIGFHRKEAFFRRVAAMQCVSPGTSPAWHQCYQLLLDAVTGYNIELDPRNMVTGRPCGWPVIQHRVLHELVYSARRMGNPQLAVRHMTLLLHTMYPHLPPADQQEAVTGLESLTARCQGTPQPLSTDTSVILPPVHLTTLPTVRCFKLLAPPAHLRPVKVGPSDDSAGSVFIYTPLSLGQERRADSSSVDFQWVAEDMCEVQLQVVNPLSVELSMHYMGLLTEGVEVEVFPASPVIPPESPPMMVKLVVKPQKSGELKILGYSTQVLGVCSHCRLRDLPAVLPQFYTVDIVPALPQVALSCSLPKAAAFSPVSSPDGATVVANASALLYAGQSQDCVVTLHNVSSHAITSLTVKLDVRNDAKEYLDRMLAWSDDNIQSQLPLQPGAQLCFSLCLYGNSDFLLPPVASPDVSSSSVSSHSRAESMESKGAQSVEAMLSVQYSGGPGEEAGYCRRSSLAVSIDVLPSVYITNWDALPSSSGQEVALVLDLLNVSSHQVDVVCGNSSAQITAPIILETQQCRRVTVTVPRIAFPDEENQDKCESRIPDKYRVWRSPDFHSQCLAHYVDIHWTMPAAKVSGKVNIDYIKWTDAQLNILRAPAITWEVLVNGQHYTAPDLLIFSVGQSLPVSVTLSASLGVEAHEDVFLSVQPVQEAGQGEGQRDLDPATYVCLGSQTLFTSKLSSDTTITHCCSLVFLCAGRYRLNITCKCRHSVTHEQVTWSCLPVPEFTIEDKGRTGGRMHAVQTDHEIPVHKKRETLVESGEGVSQHS
ncbi:hypothetical protein BaRGS_00032878 [Batillaria attramentaria]|uniref:Trafficking protein particle complex subunit 9-like n=1 Tax=Batillaria attramentaria TaxID=370345 RepID=A0ABD0JLQ0_9CAEN